MTSDRLCGDCHYFRHCHARGKHPLDALCYEEPSHWKPPKAHGRRKRDLSAKGGA